MTGSFIRGVTIDSPSSVDLDDAVYVEETDSGWVVTIGIALIGDNVAKDSDIDRAARASGFTEYAATSIRSWMLPRDITESTLSLLPGADRPVMAVRIELDRSFKAVSCEVFEAKLKNEGRLTQASAGRIVDDAQHPLHPMLSQAWTVATGLLNARRIGGALAFFSPSSGVFTDEEGRIVDLGSFRQLSRGYLIVQELMILANSALAERFARMGVRLVFRNHRGNPVADRSSLASDLALASNGGPMSEAAARRLSIMIEKATLSPQATGHFALNLPVYAWFTSPIRRYADLVNQRIALAVSAGKPSPYTASELDDIASEMNALYKAVSDRKSDHFVGASRTRADAIRQADRYDRLDDTLMTSVIKAAHADGEFSQALLGEIGRRLDKEGLTSKDIGRLILTKSRPDVVEVALLHLADAPHRSVSVLDYLSGDNHVGEPEWVDSTSRDGFVTDVSVPVADLVYKGSGTAGSKKAAKQSACVAVLCSFAGVSIQPAISVASAAKSSATSAPSGDANRKGDLITLCHTRKYGLPLFKAERTGPPHAPTFETTVSVIVSGKQIVSGPHVSTSKKDGERVAAAAMISLLESTVSSKGSTPAANDNPKSALQEYCQKAGWPLPVYDVSQTGPSHMPSFTAKVKVLAPGRSLASSSFVAGNRKDAERLAATDLLSSMSGSAGR